jgi:hypothetical protein
MNQNYYITEAVHNIKEFTDIGMLKKGTDWLGVMKMCPFRSKGKD